MDRLHPARSVAHSMAPVLSQRPGAAAQATTISQAPPSSSMPQPGGSGHWIPKCAAAPPPAPSARAPTATTSSSSRLSTLRPDQVVRQVSRTLEQPQPSVVTGRLSTHVEQSAQRCQLQYQQTYQHTPHQRLMQQQSSPQQQVRVGSRQEALPVAGPCTGSGQPAATSSSASDWRSPQHPATSPLAPVDSQYQTLVSSRSAVASAASLGDSSYGHHPRGSALPRMASDATLENPRTSPQPVPSPQPSPSPEARYTHQFSARGTMGIPYDGRVTLASRTSPRPSPSASPEAQYRHGLSQSHVASARCMDSPPPASRFAMDGQVSRSARGPALGGRHAEYPAGSPGASARFARHSGSMSQASAPMPTAWCADHCSVSSDMPHMFATTALGSQGSSSLHVPPASRHDIIGNLDASRGAVSSRSGGGHSNSHWLESPPDSLQNSIAEDGPTEGRVASLSGSSSSTTKWFLDALPASRRDGKQRRAPSSLSDSTVSSTAAATTSGERRSPDGLRSGRWPRPPSRRMDEVQPQQQGRILEAIGEQMLELIGELRATTASARSPQEPQQPEHSQYFQSHHAAAAAASDRSTSDRPRRWPAASPTRDAAIAAKLVPAQSSAPGSSASANFASRCGGGSASTSTKNRATLWRRSSGGFSSTRGGCAASDSSVVSVASARTASAASTSPPPTHRPPSQSEVAALAKVVWEIAAERGWRSGSPRPAGPPCAASAEAVANISGKAAAAVQAERSARLELESVLEALRTECEQRGEALEAERAARAQEVAELRWALQVNRAKSLQNADAEIVTQARTSSDTIPRNDVADLAAVPRSSSDKMEAAPHVPDADLQERAVAAAAAQVEALRNEFKLRDQALEAERAAHTKEVAELRAALEAIVAKTAAGIPPAAEQSLPQQQAFAAAPISRSLGGNDQRVLRTCDQDQWPKLPDRPTMSSSPSRESTGQTSIAMPNVAPTEKPCSPVRTRSSDPPSVPNASATCPRTQSSWHAAEGAGLCPQPARDVAKQAVDVAVGEVDEGLSMLASAASSRLRPPQARQTPQLLPRADDTEGLVRPHRSCSSDSETEKPEVVDEETAWALVRERSPDAVLPTGRFAILASHDPPLLLGSAVQSTVRQEAPEATERKPQGAASLKHMMAPISRERSRVSEPADDHLPVADQRPFGVVKDVVAVASDNLISIKGDDIANAARLVGAMRSSPLSSPHPPARGTGGSALWSLPVGGLAGAHAHPSARAPAASVSDVLPEENRPVIALGPPSRLSSASSLPVGVARPARATAGGVAVMGPDDDSEGDDGGVEAAQWAEETLPCTMPRALHPRLASHCGSAPPPIPVRR